MSRLDDSADYRRLTAVLKGRPCGCGCTLLSPIGLMGGEKWEALIAVEAACPGCYSRLIMPLGLTAAEMVEGLGAFESRVGVAAFARRCRGEPMHANNPLVRMDLVGTRRRVARSFDRSRGVLFERLGGP